MTISKDLLLKKLNFHLPFIFILSIAIILRFYNLESIPGPVFDEVFYAHNAINYLNGERFFTVHPPLGTYLITLSIYLYNIFPFTESVALSDVSLDKINPISFRWLVSLIGVCLVYISYRLSFELINKRFFASLTALFFCLDGSILVDSRFGLINVFLSFFGFIALLYFIKGIKSSNNFYFVLSGLALGAAISIKWNGLGFWLFLILFSLQFFITDKILRLRNHTQKEINLSFSGISLTFMLPFLVYLIIWIPHLTHNQISFLEQHHQMLSFHFENIEDKAHPYSSSWFTWPLMIRPIAYYFNSKTFEGSDGSSIAIFQDVHLMPNPALNFFALLAVIVITFKWFQVISRSIHSKKIDESLIVITLICFGFYLNFLPWAFATRSTFIYHFQPSAFFAFMALAYLLSGIDKSKNTVNKILIFSVLISVIISSIYWLPLQLGIPISSESFYSRMWFASWI
jgi:dolichyl-phosphate-mannose-protein mannosyltransferase